MFRTDTIWQNSNIESDLQKLSAKFPISYYTTLSKFI